jgi:hypothetical protein
MKRTIHVYAAIAMLAMLPGCGRLVDWGKSNFYQGEQVDNYRCDIKPYIRSVTIYDQFTTRATFDALWLSDEVRLAFVDLHVSRQGKDEERKNAVLRRQLEENNHYLSFYVLSLHDIKLGDPESAWSLFLRVNEQFYQPMEIKEIELPYEYQIFFGKAWNRFKVPYLVRFSATDADDMPLITQQTEAIELHMRSANKENAFVWPLHSNMPKIEIKTCAAEKQESLCKRRKKAYQPKPPRTPRKKRKKKLFSNSVDRTPRRKRAGKRS